MLPHSHIHYLRQTKTRTSRNPHNKQIGHKITSPQPCIRQIYNFNAEKHATPSATTQPQGDRNPMSTMLTKGLTYIFSDAKLLPHTNYYQRTIAITITMIISSQTKVTTSIGARVPKKVQFLEPSLNFRM